MEIPLKIKLANFLWVLHYFYSNLTAGAIELKICKQVIRVHIKKNPKYQTPRSIIYFLEKMNFQIC